MNLIINEFFIDGREIKYYIILEFTKIIMEAF